MDNLVIVKILIPKGSKYYTGNYGPYLGNYASKEMILKEEVKDNRDWRTVGIPGENGEFTGLIGKQNIKTNKITMIPVKYHNRPLNPRGINIPNPTPDHFEIKRFSSIIKVTSNLNLQEMKGQNFENIISQYVERIRKDRKNFKCFWILVDSRRIGTLHIQTLPGKILYIHWIDIEKEHRGHKYATTVLLYIIDKYAKKGYKEFHLEVPGNAPDARHIYEKLGFIDTGRTREEHNNSWNGLTEMVLKL